MSKLILDKLDAILEVLRNNTEEPEIIEDTIEENEFELPEDEAFKSKLKLRLYKSFLNSVIHDTDNRIILLGDGYIFSDDDEKSYVISYRSKEASVLNKDYPIKLKAIGSSLFISSCSINDIEGTFYGAVCLNKAGLLFYAPFNSPVSLSGDLNLVAS